MSILNITVETVKSKGGVEVALNVKENLLIDASIPYPPPEILQKLYQSNHLGAFDSDIQDKLKVNLGYYCDLQSLHSEDALTWSVFGNLAYSSNESKVRFLQSLLKIIEIDARVEGNVIVWLWRRIPHPETLVSGGPEIDFGIQTENLLIIGEAKWLSSVGISQGKDGNKNQIDLRKEFIAKYGRRYFPTVERFVILGVSLNGGVVKNTNEKDYILRDITWDVICENTIHPFNEELKRYLINKKSKSKTV
jgi:hypothetical protein